MRPLLPLVCLAVLSGCAAQTNSRYPSLLPRPIESRSDAEPEVAPPAAAVADPATDAKIATMKATLDKTAASFATAADHAEHLARTAKGAAVGSDPWIAAQTALAELDDYRSTTSSTVTDLEQLAIERGADGQPDYPGVEALRPVAEKALADQIARITAIEAMLPSAAP